MHRILCCLGLGLSLLAVARLASGAEPNRPNQLNQMNQPNPANQPNQANQPNPASQPNQANSTAQSEPETLFENLDINRDGAIEDREIPPALNRKLKTFLKAADKNGDHRVTKEEFLAAMARLKGGNAKGSNVKGAAPATTVKRQLPPGVKLEANLAYVEGGSEQNRLDLYLPDPAQGPVPVVIWIHGGAWQMGSKDDCQAVPLVLKGFALASINYRLSPQAAFPAQIEDCKAAIRWLRAHADKYHLDGQHVGVWGESAGGHLAALLGTSGNMKAWDASGGCLDQSSRVQAVCDWFGPSDFTVTIDKADISAVKRLLGDPPATDLKEKAAAASPITYVSNTAAPFLIFHGDKDETVPVDQSQRLADALHKAGVETSLEIVQGAGHGGPLFASEENQNRILAFFTKHLGATSAQPTPASMSTR